MLLDKHLIFEYPSEKWLDCCVAYEYLAFHLSVNGQKSFRARVTLFHQLQAKHQIPIKKSVKNKLMTT